MRQYILRAMAADNGWLVVAETNPGERGIARVVTSDEDLPSAISAVLVAARLRDVAKGESAYSEENEKIFAAQQAIRNSIVDTAQSVRALLPKRTP